MVVDDMYAKAVKSLWRGKCTVTVCSNSATDENTGRTAAVETDICSNEPCRISFDTVSATQPENSAAQAVQSITLFIGRTVTVPPGAKITITQNGMTEVYERSGKPAVYSNHQEIPLAFRGWA